MRRILHYRYVGLRETGSLLDPFQALQAITPHVEAKSLKRRLSLLDQDPESRKKRCISEDSHGSYKDLANTLEVFKLIFDGVLKSGDDCHCVEYYLTICKDWKQGLQSIPSYWNTIVLPTTLQLSYFFADVSEEESAYLAANYAHKHAFLSQRELIDLYPIPFDAHNVPTSLALKQRKGALVSGLGFNDCNASRIRVLGLGHRDLPLPLDVPFPNLTTLYLEGGDGRAYFGDRVWEHFQEFFPNLRTLIWYKPSPMFLSRVPIGMLSKITTLGLYKVDGNEVGDLRSIAPSLKSLEIHLTNKGGGPIISHDGLEDLRVHVLTIQPDPSFLCELSVPQVKKLQLVDAPVRGGLSSFTNLVELESRGHFPPMAPLLCSPKLQVARIDLDASIRNVFARMLEFNSNIAPELQTVVTEYDGQPYLDDSWKFRCLKSRRNLFPDLVNDHTL